MTKKKKKKHQKIKKKKKKKKLNHLCNSNKATHKTLMLKPHRLVCCCSHPHGDP